MGKIIVIDGLDGSGKHTQATLLYEYLKEKNIKCKIIDFPKYGSRTGGIVKEYLNGDIYVGDSFDDKFKTALLYSFDRMYNMYFVRDENNKSIMDYYNEGYVIVCDRYTSSNYLYMTHDMRINEIKKFICSIEYVEYSNMKLPRPDISIFLSVPPEKSMELINIRGNEKDIHENLITLRKTWGSLAMYEHICHETDNMICNNTHFVECVNEDGELYSIEHITEIVKKLVNDQIIKNI